MVLVEAAGLVSSLEPGAMAFLSLASLVTMVSMVSMCTTCCRKKVKNSDPDDVAYGVIVAPEDVPKAVQFRNGSGRQKSDRHSQPGASNKASNSAADPRSSAPPRGPRALPDLPENTYAAINKTRIDKDIEYADGPTQLYESIDRDNDSTVDPFYSKVTDPRSNRKYDYPIFMKNTRVRDAEDPFYQSASQIYAAGSEDPYSSIASEPRIALAQQEDDSSSAYDPGYAKVKPTIEKTEAELDQLYSKIRRTESRRGAESPVPGPSTQADLVHTGTDQTSIREPSYRYITVRESADVIRARLEEQGRLGPGGLPIREHYYSTIGNEYESVEDGSTTYARTARIEPPNQFPPPDGLSISVSNNEFAPAPPTSPIPERLPEMLSRSPQPGPQQEPGTLYSSISRRPTPSGPSPTIPTVVRAPTRSRPTNAVVVRPSVVVADGAWTTTRDYPNDTRQMEEIHAFMTRPLLPYGNEALLNRRVTEEREVVTEERRSRGPMPDQPISSYDSARILPHHDVVETPRVYNVEIKRVPAGQQAATLDGQRGQNGRPDSLVMEGQKSLPGPSSPGQSKRGEEEMVRSFESTSSRGRSQLPIATNDNEIREHIGRARQRRQESIEREEREKMERERTVSRERRRREKVEEELRKERQGTVYTSNDYLPKTCLRQETRRGHRAAPSLPPELQLGLPTFPMYSSKFDPRRLGPVLCVHIAIPPVTPVNFRDIIVVWLCWLVLTNASLLLFAFPEESGETESKNSGAGGCEGGACFCHSKSPRDVVAQSNRRQMTEISFDAPSPNVLPPFDLS
ncbi:unnamed protein product, partial [Mesorhabditis spiculigera]